MPADGPRTSRQTLASVALALLGLLALAVLGYRLARDDSLATLVELEGAPERDTAARAGTWVKAAKGDRFSDAARLGAGHVARPSEGHAGHL